jgi:DNA-binding NarL/FixJ family response regulator
MTQMGYGIVLLNELPCGQISSMKIAVGIVEDHSEFRQSLIFLISTCETTRVAWAVGSAEEAMDNQPLADIILLDINLPNLSGIKAIPMFKERNPEQKIIMLTIQDDEESIMNAIRAGADGYILKKTSPQKILEAIEQVYAGGAALTPIVAKQVLALFKPQKPSMPPAALLTPREKEILTLITQGMSTQVIADTLFISAQTVRNHIKSIYEKLHVHSKAHAVAKALKEKIV